MKSALEIVAFSSGCQPSGIVALLEVAIKALDNLGTHAAAAHADMALTLLLDHQMEKTSSDFAAIGHFE